MNTPSVRGAIFRPGASDAVIETLSIDELRSDEVLVRLVATGICHSDLLCRNGFAALPRPVILGHEGAGIIEQVGSAVRDLRPGDKVVMTFLPCGACPNCRDDLPAYCHNFMQNNFTGRRADGSTALRSVSGEVSAHFLGQSAFSTHSVANERNVLKVRDDAPLELLGPLGCGVQTGAGSVINVLKAEKGSSLAVFGAGGVGMSAVIAAVIYECAPIIVVEPNPARRELALELGAHHAIDPLAGGNIVEQLQALSGGGLANAFDTTGIPSVIAQAADALGMLGKLALVTAQAADSMLALPILPMIGRGITVRAVNMGDSVPRTFIPKLIDLIVEGRFPIEKLVRFYRFEDINTALEDQEHGRTIKPIIRFE